MLLSEIVNSLPSAVRLQPDDPEIRGLSCDSRAVQEGFLFAAIPGSRTDGHLFLETARRAGAVASLVEREEFGAGTARVLVPDAEAALGLAACTFHGQPSRGLDLIGVTGTNGKTTTAYLVQHILARAGSPTGRLGTVSYHYPSAEEAAPLTTPEAPRLQAALRRMADEGARSVVMEVSSHALARKRVEGCRFACAAFTNLTQDHLDYHGSMEAYFEAKLLLFTRYAHGAPAVISVEDPFGERILQQRSERVVTFGLGAGDVQLQPTSVAADGIRGALRFPGGECAVSAPLAGEFNARNLACALAVAWSLGVDMDAAVRAVATAPQVPGRIESIGNDLGLTVLVDYAHTPDALYRVLESVRRFTEGRLLCVFGCGGDRDPGKRPQMARAAARWCDGIVLTADNSRSEPTGAILDQVEQGLPAGWEAATSADRLAGPGKRYARVEDRREAIRLAVEAMHRGDCLLLAGKGHEATQTLGDQVLPFDDRSEARKALAGRKAA